MWEPERIGWGFGLFSRVLSYYSNVRGRRDLVLRTFEARVLGYVECRVLPTDCVFGITSARS